MELTDHNRWIYDGPSIGRGNPRTGFDDYLATPEPIASWVAELAGSVVGLTRYRRADQPIGAALLREPERWMLQRKSRFIQLAR